MAKVGVILSGHNPFLVDFLSSKLMDIDYKEVPFLKHAIRKGYISENDIEQLTKIKKVSSFRPERKGIFDKILLNNFFIGIRFSKLFEKFFNKGPLPWILFKMGVKQDKYLFENRNIDKLYKKENINKEEDQKIKKCLEIYCPLCMKNPDNKKCIKCMYCYQILPELIKFKGDLGSFRMQMERFGKFIKNKF